MEQKIKVCYGNRTLILLQVISVLLLMTLLSYLPQGADRNRQIWSPKPATNLESHPKVRILFWANFTCKLKGPDIWKFIFSRLLSGQCPENRCELVYDKLLIDSADAIIFSSSYMFRIEEFETPKYRRQDQFWTFLSFEPDNMLRSKLMMRGEKRLDQIDFNWTMHFRHDSDIVVPYGSIKLKPTARTVYSKDVKKDYWSEKDSNRLAIWMASHCETHSKRETYIHELQKYVRVDVYGRCGKYKCGRSTILDERSHWKTEECAELTNQYMFYLAFENSICRDYVTEKFFRTLQQDLIPVVMGGADYASIAPPNSYIDALQFPGPKQLAVYLQKVANDKDLYNKYFEWKPHYDIKLGYPYSPMICDLCTKLHQIRSEPPPKPTNLNIRQWIKNSTWTKNWVQVLNEKFKNIKVTS